MARIYDYNTGKLFGKYRDIVVFDLDIRRPITQVYGKSGTGKSFLVDFIRIEQRYAKYNGGDAENVSNIFVFDDDNEESLTVEKLSKINNSLVIIDRCDLILTSEIVDCIVSDRSNHYLLFSRTALPLGLSPNYYGEFDNKDNVISISYKFNEKGWF